MSEWQSIDSAPKDGTLLLLLVGFHDGNHSADYKPTEDAATWRTVGFNGLDNTGDDEWFMAGWCWEHDHFTDGGGKPIAWQPLADKPRESQP